MTRPLRVELAGGWYHVTARGNERRAIYRDDTDRGRFLETVGKAAEQLSRYVHLNPVRVKRLGMGKATGAEARERRPGDAEMVARRVGCCGGIGGVLTGHMRGWSGGGWRG